MLASQTVNRRSFLLVTAAAATCGCQPNASPQAKPQAATRTDVPLRVVVAGTPRTAEVIKTAWKGVSEQPLDVTLIDSTKVTPADWEASILEAMRRSDLGILPSGMSASLSQSKLIGNWREDTFEDDEDSANVATHLFPVLQECVASYGGNRIGQPLGTTLPCLILTTSDEAANATAPQTWQDYERAVEELTGKGQRPVCAEPLVGGAAAEMFLWRANRCQPPIWLFDRESLAPVIADDVYVTALESMARCVKWYGDQRLSAGDVWQRASDGTLKLAIGWPAPHSDKELIADADRCRFAPLPFGISTDRLSDSPAQALASAQSIVAIISSQCRQSDAARRFAQWLAGGEGTGMIRDSIEGFTILQTGEVNRATANTNAGSVVDNYDQILSTEMNKVVIRPAMRILQFQQYLHALDVEILECVGGKKTASQALQSASDHWAKLHDQVGVDKQAKAWRMTQGLSN